jgi:hypothetical protein
MGFRIIVIIEVYLRVYLDICNNRCFQQLIMAAITAITEHSEQLLNTSSDRVAKRALLVL